MKLGILSDNHGRLGPVRSAVEVFRDHDVDGIVHCGDLCGVETLELLASIPCWFVWGNMDVPDPTWRPWVEATGAHWPEAVPVVIEADGNVIAVCHGHERVFGEVCRSDRFDYVLHGHTHRRGDQRCGRTRIINPGALHRATPKTVAVLDTTADYLQFFDIATKRESRADSVSK